MNKLKKVLINIYLRTMKGSIRIEVHHYYVIYPPLYHVEINSTYAGIHGKPLKLRNQRLSNMLFPIKLHTR